MKTIYINTKSKSYPVIIGSDAAASLSEAIRKLKLPGRIFAVIDENVDRIYGAKLRKLISEAAEKKKIVRIRASERAKSFKSVNQLLSRLAEEKFSRDSVILAIGGGTIGDLAGFTASVYMRGINLIHMPTTLLSAIDSSVGGKTAINFKDAKNLIGSFYQPDLVLIDTKFLNSLPENEMVSGFGEAIKYSYLIDRYFYARLNSEYQLLGKRDPGFLNWLIFESIKIKAAVVSKDENEITGLRRILNFGHTFAHAFESGSDYNLSHGKAVIAGIICALLLSLELKLINQRQLKYMLELPLKFKSSIHLNDFHEKDIIRRMLYDKKRRDDRLEFILLKNFGFILVDVNVEQRLITKVLSEIKKILV